MWTSAVLQCSTTLVVPTLGNNFGIRKRRSRRILSRHRSGCRDAERRQLLSRQKNDVATRNDYFINWPSLDKGFSSCDMMTRWRYYSRLRQRLQVMTIKKSRPNELRQETSG